MCTFRFIASFLLDVEFICKAIPGKLMQTEFRLLFCVTEQTATSHPSDMNIVPQFWHVQHEFVEAEKNILGRADNKVSSRAGYAGGNLGMKDGKVYVTATRTGT